MPHTASPLWEIHLLGDIALVRVGHDDAAPRRLRAGRSAALLALLARQPGVALARATVLEMLWPGVDPAVGRNRLRQELFALRALLDVDPDRPVLVAAGDALRLDPDTVRTDLQRFEAAVRARDLWEARRLWHGPFAPGIDDEWAAEVQQRLESLWDTLGGLPTEAAPGRTTRLILGALLLLPGGLDDAEMAEAAPRPDRDEALGTLRAQGWIEREDGVWVLPERARAGARTRCGDALEARLLARYLQRPPWGRPERERHWRSIVHLLECGLDREGRDPGLHTALADLLTSRLIGMGDVGLADAAGRLSERARVFARKLPIDRRIPLLTSSAFAVIGRGSEALALLEEAESLARAAGKEGFVLDSLIARGIAAHHAEQDATSLRCFESALALCDHPSRRPQRRAALIEMATALAAQQRLPEAQRRLEEARALEDETFPPVNRAGLRMRQAAILCDLGDVDRARATVDEALRTLVGGERFQEVADCERLLARIALREGHTGLARLHVLRARETYRRFGNHGGVAATEGLLAEALCREGDCAAGVAAWERGLDHWRETGHARWQAEFWIGLARCRWSQGDADAAMEALDAAHRCLGRTRAPLLRKAERALRRELRQEVSARQ